MQQLKVVSDSPEATDRIGWLTAGYLRPGDVLSITGELGAGKTVLVKGIAAGLDIDPAQVTSPTFSLMNEYTGRLPMYHFDAYRINRPEEWEDLGYEEYFRGEGITCVEWGNMIEEYLPRVFLEIHIEKDAVQELQRTISFRDVGGGYEKLMAELRKEVDHAHSWD